MSFGVFRRYFIAPPPPQPRALGVLSKPITSHTGLILVSDGAGAWTEKPVKVWIGSGWVQKPLKFWNGLSWQLV